MVTEDNHNKFYEMKENPDKSISISYGRVDLTRKEEIVNKNWDSLYKSKIKKGYKDVTELVSNTIGEKNYLKESSNIVDSFINKMKSYTKNIVNKTYIKAENITKQQIEAAQDILDKIKSSTDVNKLLLELYSIIPRKMKNVKDYLPPKIELNEILINEQDYIDSVKSYVSGFGELVEESSYLESIGVKIEETSNLEEIQYIINQLKSYKTVFKVDYPKEEERFQNFIKNKENTTTRFLIHGTRCFSVIPIIEQGLKIRPSGNFSFSGKAYGDGTYFSEITTKSLNYTGYDPDKILLIYKVHTGNPFIYNGYYRGNDFTLCESELNKRGFDSTYVNPGNGLLNSEIIVYNESQYYLNYIIHI